MLAASERKKLPTRCVAVVQQLALWLPDDGRLLWLLAELANAHGDISLAAAMFDGCVIQFNLESKELRRHRQVVLAASAPKQFLWRPAMPLAPPPVDKRPDLKRNPPAPAPPPPHRPSRRGALRPAAGRACR